MPAEISSVPLGRQMHKWQRGEYYLNRNSSFDLIFVKIRVLFYRTQVSLGSGLWVPVSVTPYLHTRALDETLLM